MKYRVVISAWVLAICAAILPDDVQAQEIATADSVRKYKFLAKTAREKKEYDAAIGYYTALLQYSPNDLKAAFFLGDTYYRTRDFAGARIALRRAVALDSLHLNSNLRLYAVYRAVGAPDSAAMSLERALLKKPSAADHRRKLADLYRREGQSERAIVHYEQLAAAGEDPELFEMLAVLHQELGQTAEALAWRRRLVARGEGGSAQLESIVEMQLETGDIKGAYNSLLELARVDSQNAYSYYSRLAAIADERSDDSMRVTALKGMVETDPGDLESVATLVQWHQGRGEWAKARIWLERGLQIDPASSPLLLLKGDGLVRAGDEEGAIAVFERARANPDWEQVAQQRIWQLRPPETEEEKLKREFFGGAAAEEQN